MRVRRTRAPVEDEAKPAIKARIRRSRPAPEPSEPVSRVRRVRRVPEVDNQDINPRMLSRVFSIDWSWSWQKKFQLFLMCSYLYYQMNRSVITDSDYDRLCVDLLAGWKSNDHQHKHLITRDDLRATTGFAIKEYPGVVIGGAHFLMNAYEER
jgi:hypothetical protein